MLPERAQERRLEIGLLEGLAHEVDSPQLHRLDDSCRAALARQDQNGYGAVDPAERRKRSEPVHFTRHDEIENDRGRGRTLEAQNRLFGVLHGLSAISAPSEEI